MIYDCSNTYDVARLQAKIVKAIERGDKVELISKTYRSRSQNSYLHLCLGIVAIETGNTIEWVKTEYFKRLVNPHLFVANKQDAVLGQTIRIRSTTELITREMTEAIDRFKDWASQAGIYIPDTNEELQIASAMAEIDKMRRWL